MSDKNGDIGLIEVFKRLIKKFIGLSWKDKLLVLLYILIIILIAWILIVKLHLQGTPGNMPFQP